MRTQIATWIFQYFIVAPPADVPNDPCNPSPCGANAICKERNNAGSCSCIPEYTGDPYTGCRPECVLNSECPRDRACINNKCRDPCPGMCGAYAECRIINHSPSCACLPGYTGNPLSACQIFPVASKIFFPHILSAFTFCIHYQYFLSFCEQCMHAGTYLYLHSYLSLYILHVFVLFSLCRAHF